MPRNLRRRNYGYKDLKKGYKSFIVSKQHHKDLGTYLSLVEGAEYVQEIEEGKNNKRSVIGPPVKSSIILGCEIQFEYATVEATNGSLYYKPTEESQSNALHSTG